MTSTLETIDVWCYPSPLIGKNGQQVPNSRAHERRHLARFSRDLEASGSGGTFVPDFSPDTVQTQLLVGPDGQTPAEDLPGWEQSPDDSIIRVRTVLTCDVCRFTFTAVDYTQGSTDPGLLVLLQYVSRLPIANVGERRSDVTVQFLDDLMNPKRTRAWFHPRGPGVSHISKRK